MAQETGIVTEEMGIPKVWSTMEYHCRRYFPLWGVGNCCVYLEVSLPAPWPLAWWGRQGVDVLVKTLIHKGKT